MRRIHSRARAWGCVQVSKRGGHLRLRGRALLLQRAVLAEQLLVLVPQALQRAVQPLIRARGAAPPAELGFSKG